VLPNLRYPQGVYGSFSSVLARAEPLHSKAAGQVDTLIAFVAGLDDDDLRRPCPDREKLGDGTVGTIVAHTAANYERIAAFASGAEVEGRHGHLAAAGSGQATSLRDQLASARHDLDRLAVLDDPQLDSIPPEGAFRFCDGTRTLEEVLTALLTHQGHQIDALTQA
jgi:hypothetical protein